MDSENYISKSFKDNEVITACDYYIDPDSNWNKYRACVVTNLELPRYWLLKNCSYFRCDGGIVVMFQEETLLLTDTP